FWIEERSNIEDFDGKTNLVTMARKSCTNLVGSHGSQLADYYLDNVFEALSEPGEWYLDRQENRIWYLPLEGETVEDTKVVMPRVLQFLRLKGDAQANREVTGVTFQGITFQHADWRHPGECPEASHDLLANPSATRMNRGDSAAASQAASDVPGVIHFESARDCALEDCTIRNVGWYGVFLSNGCTGVRLVGNELYDLGAGGVKINGTAAGEDERGLTAWNRIADNHIHKAGRVFHSAVGVLAMHSAGNVIAHNHIHDLFYSGISCGWVWGYIPSTTHDNIIEFNHIHHIGQGLLSDMGGVYLLGIQPGTVVRNNLIHDVEKAHYGGWALYTDEGSSHIILENNICYNTNGDVFHQHYGRENTVRNNILVFGDEAATAYTRIEPHVGVTFQRNILVSAGAPMFRQLCSDDSRRIVSEGNLFWDTTRKEPLFCRKPESEEELGLEDWRELGHDRTSIVADPGFVDLEERDLTLAKDSPALRIGFRPIDISSVGPRSRDLRD
ncbi:MAG: right-handed parallel beta-helix repeat-containing protein, partial [Lentisphaeria bacterium]|nr:right-handed parallel beta-helix repeat-containing protein [Lentisphaeria bacterium]